MKKIYLLLFSISLLLASCEKESALQNEYNSSVKKETEYVFSYKTNKHSDANTKGVINKWAIWENGSVIRVKFLNGNANVRKKVKEVSAEWLKYANLDFQFVDTNEDADVKIAFRWNSDRVSWSYIGTECQDVDQNKPSMNLVIFNENDANELNSEAFAASILREFGHVLGLIHEHQGPKTGMELDPDRVYAYFRQFGWDDARIDDEIIYSYNKFQTNYTEFDEESIMLLFIPPHLIVDGEDQTGTNKVNTKLSKMDKSFIQSMYPFPEYERGAEGKVYMTIPTWQTGAWGLHKWDYDNMKENTTDTISKTYKTRVIGEYEWTTENLRLKYWNLWATLYDFMNHSQAKVDALVGAGKCTVKEFDEIFGTWITNYGEAINYRGNYIFKRNNANGNRITGFELPNTAAICQLFGMAPVKTGNVKQDFSNFVYASPGDVSQTFDLPYLKSYKNISGLTITPLGFMTNEVGGGNHYSFGYGFGLQMKDYAHMFAFSDASGIRINLNLYHFSQARYCRELSDQELGYKLYIDSTNDKVLKLPLNVSANGLPELKKGLERGIALRYVTNNRIRKAWSEIQAEAKEISKSLYIY